MKNINKKIIEIALKRCSNPDKLHDFLFPEKIDLIDPFELKGVKDAYEKIIAAVNSNKKVLIYGDYDADGITSTALLYKALTKIHDQIYYYIPQREKEGYGLNKEALNQICNQGIELLITVDCGIKATELIREFTQKGIDFIITDHHIPDDILPEGIIVNPKLSEEIEFYDLAGVGVAYLIASALSEKYQEIKEINSELIQLAALGTVADLVNLSMENRKIVRKGLIELNTKPILGIQSLVNKKNIVEINSKTIAFLLAPIINSSGRMKNPEIAFKLLISEDLREIDSLADELINLNDKRKQMVEEVYKEAQKIILEKHYFSDPIIIVEKEDWAQGILGIVASKLLNEYNRPVILLSESEEDIYKGSGRSIESYNIFNGLKKQEKIIQAFGGHAQAAGLSIKKTNIDILRNKLNLDIYKDLNYKDFQSEYSSDAEFNGLDDITENMYKDLALLEPFGVGNPEPVFKFSKPVDLKIKKIGKLKDHLRIIISDKNKKINGVYFNFQEYPGDNVKSNLFFSIGINEWQNKVSLQLEVKQIIEGVKTKSQKMEQKIYSNIYYTEKINIKNFTNEERIKYNEIWTIFNNSKTIIYSNSGHNFLQDEKKELYLNFFRYDNEKEFPENFNNVKTFLNLNKEAVLLSDTLLFKKETLFNIDNYIFLGEEPKKNLLYSLKDINPEIKIYVTENSLKEKDMSREELSYLYLMLKKIYSSLDCYNLSDIEKIIKKDKNIDLTTKEIFTGVMIFEELGFLNYSYKNDLLEIKIAENPNKQSLDNSRLYTMTKYN